MKRFFTKKSVAIVLVTILLVVFLPFKSVSAATVLTYQTKSGVVYTYKGNGLWQLPNDGNFYPDTTVFADFNGVTPQTYLDQEKSYDDSLASSDSGSFIGGIIKGLANYSAGAANLPAFIGWVTILHTLNILTAVLTAVMGAVFDLSINFSILSVKQFFLPGGVVDTMWVMLRDLVNITFIFILLYIAITKIIGSWGIKAKSQLSSLIVSVILINFSMFFTKILIDAGNLVAVQFYNMISPVTLGYTISSTILKGAGLMSALKSATSLSGQVNTLTSLILQIIAGGVLLWVYFLGSMLMVGRVVMLVFLAIVSPVGFIGKSVPGLGSLSEKWWSTLTNQLLVAPVLLFFLYFTTQLIQTQTVVALTTSAKNAISTFAPPSLDAAGILAYILVIVTLWWGIKFTKKLSGEVGEMTVNVFKGVAAAGAIALTAGAAGAAIGAEALGAAASTEGAMGAANAAKLAGKGKIGQWGARLAFTAKNIPQAASAAKQSVPTLKEIGETKIGKFVTGDYEKSGATGWLQTQAREKIMGGLKTATSGTVDLKAVEKMLRENTKEAKENLSKKADSFTKNR